MNIDPKKLIFSAIVSVASVIGTSLFTANAATWSAPFGLVKDIVYIESYVSNVTVNGSSVVNDKIARITIPTKVSTLANDSGFVTETVTNGILIAANKHADDATNALAKVAQTGSYTDLTDKPNPPLTGKTFDFNNGAEFTKTVYAALTNIIDILGGDVTNAPAFKE